MLRKMMKAVPAMIAAAGIMAGAFALTPMQTTQDYASGNRLHVNGKDIFVSGMNIAWINFANDVGDNTLDEFMFTQQIREVRRAGGNAVRWWLHTDASNCPKIDSDGKVTGIGSRTISNMRKALDIAYEHGVVISMCLFSFDLLVAQHKQNFDVERNHKFLTVPENLDTYIQNALIPMLDSVGSHPAVMAWEVFNEPEGMSEGMTNWSHLARRVPYSDVMRFTAKIAAEVHRRTVKMATTSIHEHDKDKYFIHFTDAKFKEAAGGDELAYLDFYQPHFYPEWCGPEKSPFHQVASFWGLDRPIVIGEFPGKSWPWQGYNVRPGTDMTITAAYEWAFNNGYAGAMSWAMTDRDFGSIEETAPALKNLFDKHKNDIMIKDVVILDPTGDLATRLAFNGLLFGQNSEGRDIEALLRSPTNYNFSGRTNLIFELYIEASGGSNCELTAAMQIGNNWDWHQSAAINLGEKPKGEWFTVTLPLNEFLFWQNNQPPSNLSQINAVNFKFMAADSLPFTGVIYIDNIRVDNEVIADFDDNKPWSLSGDNVSASIVQRPGATSIFIRGGSSISSAGLRAPAASLIGKTLRVTSPDNSDLRIKMTNVQGRTIRTFKAKGSADFSLKNVPAGRYIVEIKKSGKRVSANAVTVK